MKEPNRFSTTLKAIFQLGPIQTGQFLLYRLGLLSGHYERATPGGNKVIEQPATLTFSPLFELPAPQRILEIIGKDGLQELVKEADEIADGRVRLFGGDPVPLRLTFEQPLHHWTAYEKDPSLYLPLFGEFQDVKFLWEPARFSWVFILGRAWHLTHDERYPETFWKLTESFLDGNPTNMGPNWVSAQEVALRLMAFCWSLQIFDDSRTTTQPRKERLTLSIGRHAARIPPTLIYAYSQNNNHLLSESAGLFTAGLTLPDHPQASRWLQMGWKGFHKGIHKQVDAYGEYVQHSTNYQRLMLQLALWIGALADKQKLTFPRQSREALERATHWAYSLLDPISGGMPNLGANDGAFIFPLSTGDFRDHRPVIQAAARRFMGYNLPIGTWDEMSLWFSLPYSQDRFETPRYLGDAVHGRDSWGTLRAVHYRSRPSHADQLHFDLWWHGMNIARDAGSYLYNAPAPWDNSLTHTAVHNTVSVDGLEQMTRAGRFLYLDWARGWKKKTIESDPAVLERESGHHNGYRRLGIRHDRTVTVFNDEHWEVEDSLLRVKGKPRTHTYRLHWLLPDWEWQVDIVNGGYELHLKSEQGAVKLNLLCSEPGSELTLVRAGELLSGDQLVSAISGWYSPTYGKKEAALSCALQVRSDHDVKFSSHFTFTDR
jgi:hypothetical protein